MKYVIYGAGGIGGVIGARLFQAGLPVTLIARGEHAAVLQQKGLTLVAPDGKFQLPIPTVTHPRELHCDAQTMVLLCMKSQHTETALIDLSLNGSPEVHVACVQNGVANERLALRYFANVVATVVNLPAMFLHPGEVVTHATGFGGILDSGCYPGGLSPVVETLTTDLSVAGFSAQPKPAVMRQKYAKLLLNLLNVLQAGIADEDYGPTIGRQARAEALSCFAAAGIDCASKQETRARAVYQMVDIPGYERTAGSSWQSLARGTGDIETLYLNGEICMLGRLHGVPTPANDACVRLGRALIAKNGGPNQFSTVQVQAVIDDPQRSLHGNI